MIRDSPISVDENSDVTVRGLTYKGTKELWEILTKKNVDRSLITVYDMRSYKRILESTSGNLSDNDSSGYIKTIRAPKYTDVISKPFPTISKRDSCGWQKRSTTFR